MYINTSPSIEDIRKNKRNQEGNIEHYPQCKLAGATVCNVSELCKSLVEG